MARTKISKVAKDLNVALPTVVDFLRSKNITVDDNPNARIEDDVVDILVKEFKSDKDQKTKSEQFSSERMQQRDIKKPAPKVGASEEIKLPTEINRPKIVGKIDLDRHGNPIKPVQAVESAPTEPQKPAPSVPETPAPSAPVQEAAAPVAPAKETPAAEVPAPPVKEEAPAAQPVPRKEEHPAAAAPPQSAPKAGPQKMQEVKPAPVKADKPAPREKKETPAPAAGETPKTPVMTEPKAQTPAADNAGEEIFTVGLPQNRPTINVIGKIDLSAINQSTRPRKKSKEERRNERIAKQQGAQGGGNNAGNSDGDRKKRKRIGSKEKIDIEKQGNQPGGNNGGGRGKGGEGRRGDRGNKPRKGAPQHVEVSEDDVQKQVKEVLARLTSKDKGQKKGLKWRKEKREMNAERDAAAAAAAAAESKTLKLTEFVTANDLATMMDVPINKVIGTCMNLGVMVSINQRLDAETINIVADEFGFKTEFVSAEVVEAISQEEDSEEDLVSRPPIVTVMGHVDHGKTSLLDHIRNAHVTATEAGGITQHIGAYRVKYNDRDITFLDTPGHEAFTSMRARGASVTDIAILVVAADDGIMPQTIEAINHAKAANIPIIVAINKMDKPGANPENIKQQLTEHSLVVEEWGGDVICVPISAKTGMGVDELLENVLLVAEVAEYKANPNRLAKGAVIEARLDKGRGPIATLLVQNGTLHTGDIIIAGTAVGRVRVMTNDKGEIVNEAGPSCPVEITGLAEVPSAGDTFNAVEDERLARELVEQRKHEAKQEQFSRYQKVTLDNLFSQIEQGEIKELPIIVKADVQGSVEAVTQSLEKLSNEEVRVKVIHGAVGAVSESDVMLADASNAIIVGFNVRPDPVAEENAKRDGVDIRLYRIIYDAIEEITTAMKGMLAPKFHEVGLGRVEVRQVYKITGVGVVSGSYVLSGKITRNAEIRVVRDGIIIADDRMSSLKRFKDDVKEVAEGYECGITLEKFNDIKVGDIFEAYMMEETKAE